MRRRPSLSMVATIAALSSSVAIADQAPETPAQPATSPVAPAAVRPETPLETSAPAAPASVPLETYVPAPPPAPVPAAPAPQASSAQPLPAPRPAPAPAPIETRSSKSPAADHAPAAQRPLFAPSPVVPNRAWPDLKLEVGGLLQLWAVPFDQNDPAQNDPIVLGDPNMDEGFAVRRARLSLGGSLTRSVDFGLQIGYESSFTGSDEQEMFPDLEEAFLDFHRGRLPRLQVGVNKVPFGGQQLSSSRSLLLVERAVTSEVLTFGRDVGLSIYGDYGEEEASSGKFGLQGVRWWVGLYNGSDSFFRDDNGIGDVEGATGTLANPLGLLQTLRAELDFGTKKAPHGESNLGGRTFKDITFRVAANVAGNRELEATDVAYGGDLSMFAGPLSLQLELLWNTTFPQFTNEGVPEVLADVPAFGWFVQAGYFVIPDRLQLAGRFEAFDGNVRLDDVDDLMIVTGGLNYFPFRTDALKAQLNYVRRVETAQDLKVDNDSVYLNFGAYF